MASSKTIVCPSCGFRNSPPPANHRCGSCGAKMEALGRGIRTREEELERRYQQEGFNLTWMLISLIVQGVLTAALVIGLPMVVTIFDFEGGNGMLVTIPVWFLGGLLVGLISPGRTFIEPVVASFCAAIPTVFYSGPQPDGAHHADVHVRDHGHHRRALHAHRFVHRRAHPARPAAEGRRLSFRCAHAHHARRRSGGRARRLDRCGEARRRAGIAWCCSKKSSFRAFI